jgi:hypothetical protein
VTASALSTAAACPDAGRAVQGHRGEAESQDSGSAEDGDSIPSDSEDCRSSDPGAIRTRDLRFRKARRPSGCAGGCLGTIVSGVRNDKPRQGNLVVPGASSQRKRGRETVRRALPWAIGSWPPTLQPADALAFVAGSTLGSAICLPQAHESPPGPGGRCFGAGGHLRS